MKKGVQATVDELARPIIEGMGLELVEVEWVKEGAGRYLRLYIDKEGGVTMDDCVAVSRAVEARLDEVDPIPDSYHLEVSSPGVERPLKTDADFARFAGQQVAITTFGPVAGQKRFVGELVGLLDGQVRLKVRPAGKHQSGTEIAIPRDQVARAHLHVDF